LKQVNEILFRAVCLCAAALMLLMSLLCSIRVTAVNDGAARLERENAALEAELAVLTARMESNLNLEELERYAVEKLGMQRCGPDQIILIEMPER
jgi:cell division protein FtsL